ncbi:MAG: hypothetical protein GWM90_02655, partial [Gemmatimonadetes bacterium]|nr:hypothetical protein [Gemmatimonadota bacterium]NIQ59089.1 hypothetical protein [Gemmatimonadota bacterium]NIU79292.1 hypothetical protein [Gammaproteobacteria bacterium]NIX43067.1 hypothetical protein [Gemmatimonadota bacterium]NIY12343.1 hypothetical protein [Gemmatimonadota bacterium]
DRDPPPVYAITSARPAEVGAGQVGPVRLTLDAGHPDRWVYFDFSRGATVEEPRPGGWDLAFRRFHVTTNGGPGFAGRGAAIDLGDVPLDAVGVLPDSGWTVADGDSVNAALARWYDYGFVSHLLTPRARTYGIRTADGRFAAIRFLSYYCPGPTPGCVTFEYVYRGDGSRRLD